MTPVLDLLQCNAMKRKRFRLWHSIIGLVVLLVAEGGLIWFLGSLSAHSSTAQWIGVLIFAFVGGAGTIVVSTEVIEEVRNATHMLILLSGVVFEFVAYFAFQYWYLLTILPDTFSGINNDAVSLLLHSIMIFVFNPIYMPTNSVGRGLLLINTLEALVLALFVLQNIWQFRQQDKPARRS
jgi:hypothetical protein